MSGPTKPIEDHGKLRSSKLTEFFHDEHAEKMANFQVNFKDGEPRHICYVSIEHGTPMEGTIVKDLLNTEKARRIILINERQFKQNILREHEHFINEIKSELHKIKKEKNLSDISCHKSLTEEIARGTEVAQGRVRVANYKFGAVASYLLSGDSRNQFEICIYPNINEQEKDADTRASLLVRLRNYYELGLTDMLSQYLEESTFYLESIFKGGSHYHSIKYCRNLREDLGESFDSKIKDVYHYGQRSDDATIKELAAKIVERYNDELRMLKFCREFIMLLANYVCAFLGVPHRIGLYRKRIEDIISREKECETLESYRLLVNAYRNLEFEGSEVKIPESGDCDEWIRILLWVVRRVQTLEKICRPGKLNFSDVNIFLSLHMTVPSSLLFSMQLSKFIQDQRLDNIKIITGFVSDREWIHDYVEGMIWLSDALITLLPSCFQDFFGKPVKDHTWIIWEPVYAKMLDKPVYFARETPSPSNLDDYLSQLQGVLQKAQITYQGESFRKKLRKCADELGKEVVKRNRIEYMPSYRFDEKIQQDMIKTIEDISIEKCIKIVKMIRLSFRRKTWYPFTHIHRLTKSGTSITKEDLVKSLLNDKLAKYIVPTETDMRDLVNDALKKYQEYYVRIDGKNYPIIETSRRDKFTTNLYKIVLSLQNRFKIDRDLTPLVDSYIEKSFLEV